MNGSRQIYRLDDYLQDKAQRAASPLARGGSSGLRQGMAVTPTGNASVGTVKPLPVRPPHTVQRPSGSSHNASNAGVGQDVTVDTFKPDAGGGTGGGVLTQSQMTTAYTKQLMENALSNLLAMQNRKFKYDAHSSPLYSIVQKQAEENARLASGRAYAKAKGDTGGYGSSYATLAADEAGRQAMRELDDQQLALYEAAREEFEAENASALDWYNTTKQLYEDAYLLEQDEKANAPATMTLPDGTTVEVTDAARELYAGYLDSFTNGTGYDTLKTAMINGGASEADADQAISMFKKLGGATVADQISALETSPTLSGAQDIMAKAKANGTWDSIKSQVGTKVAQYYVDAINNLDSAYEMLGVDQAAWESLAPEQQKAKIIENAAQRKKDGLIGSAEFNKILMDDVDEMVAAIDEEEITKPATELSNMVITWKNYKDRGYISEKEYNELLNGVTKKIDVEATVKKQAATLGQHASNLAGNVADDLNMSDWWKNFIKGAAKIHVGIVADYNPLSPTFIPSLLSNWKWFRKQILLNNEQEDAMEELLKAQLLQRGGR